LLAADLRALPSCAQTFPEIRRPRFAVGCHVECRNYQRNYQDVGSGLISSQSGRVRRFLPRARCK